MRAFPSLLLAVSSAFAYQVTYPSDSQGWNTTGPNVLMWQRVDTDPLNFSAVLTNQNIDYSEILDSLVDGTSGSLVCNTPQGGWPSGSNFRVNLAQDAENLDALLAQSNDFNITAVSSGASTTSSLTATATSSGSATTPSASGASTTSSETSTTPTGASAASVGADAHASLLTAIAALAAFITVVF